MGERVYEGMEIDRKEHTAEDKLPERCKRSNMGEQSGVKGTVCKEARLVGIPDGGELRPG
jgi:hypothetical protein